MNKLELTMKFSTIVFSVVGLICGLLLNVQYTTGLICLGAVFGALLSIIAALISMIIHKPTRTNFVALVVNIPLFIVIARELQII